ncbi:MAG TPA: glyoxylate/hydroxypyruvate reductase A [Bordetella sp.]
MSQTFDLGALFTPLLKAVDPDLELYAWPDPRCLEAEVAVCWHTPPGAYEKMPRLRLIHSIAAGVDNILGDASLHHIPVCRVVDPQQSEGMLQFILWSVITFHRGLDGVLADQARHGWTRPEQPPASDFHVGIMGLGRLGQDVAQGLARFGYRVSGWARTARELAGVQVHAGPDRFETFLSGLDALVCLIPLTEQTRGILDRRTFSAMPRGAALIHCGRGQHLVEADLVEALESGQLRGAVVDVFEREPLAPGHPLWNAPGLIVTPHMASVASFKCTAEQVCANIARLNAGEPLMNRVDPAAGY